MLAIRFQEELYGARVAERLNHRSAVMIDGEETGEVLEGVSCIPVRLYNPNCHVYDGDIVLVLRGYEPRGGQDEGEVVLVRPTVEAIMTKGELEKALPALVAEAEADED